MGGERESDRRERAGGERRKGWRSKVLGSGGGERRAGRSVNRRGKEEISFFRCVGGKR